MGISILVDNYINEGKTLIQDLDKAGFTVNSALWFLDTSSNSWKLIIASPVLDLTGPSEAYHRIQNNMTNVHDLLLNDISIVSPNNNLIVLLKSAFQTGKNDITGVRFTNNTINNFFISDAYIYRLA